MKKKAQKNGRRKKPAGKKAAAPRRSKKSEKEKAGSRKPRNVAKAGRGKQKAVPKGKVSKTVKKSRKVAKKGVQRPKLSQLQITRRYNKWFSDHISKKTGRIGSYSYDFSNKVLDEAYRQIQRGVPYPDIKEIIAALKETTFRFSEITYQASADSIKNVIRAPGYVTKKIKTVDIFGGEFETQYPEVAVEIAENNNTFFWIIIDKIREAGNVVKSPVFLPFVTERKQINNKTASGLTPRVLKIDFSRPESINGVNSELWQQFKAQVQNETR